MEKYTKILVDDLKTYNIKVVLNDFDDGLEINVDINRDETTSNNTEDFFMIKNIKKLSNRIYNIFINKLLKKSISIYDMDIKKIDSLIKDDNVILVSKDFCKKNNKFDIDGDVLCIENKLNRDNMMQIGRYKNIPIYIVYNKNYSFCVLVSFNDMIIQMTQLKRKDGCLYVKCLFE